MSATTSTATHAATRTSRLSTTASLALLTSLVVSFLAASAVPTPLYAVYQSEWGFSPITTTVVFGVYAVAVLLSLLVLGRLSDHIGRRPVLLAGLLGQTIAMVVFTTAAGVPELSGGPGRPGHRDRRRPRCRRGRPARPRPGTRVGPQLGGSRRRHSDRRPALRAGRAVPPRPDPPRVRRRHRRLRRAGGRSAADAPRPSPAGRVPGARWSPTSPCRGPRAARSSGPRPSCSRSGRSPVSTARSARPSCTRSPARRRS